MSWTRLRRGLIAIILLAGTFPLTAAGQQTGPTGQPAAVATGTAQIRGIVKNASDEKPLGRARVMAVADALPEPRVAISGSDGKYAITDLPAGSYTVTVTRTGYASQAWGQARTLTGTPIVLAAAQQAANIDFPLVAGRSITGRILDEDGSPLAGAVVDALVAKTEGGALTLFSVVSTQTDDRGEFRLFGLAPGQYYISAADPAFRSVSTPKGVLHYSPTYYPGESSADQAKPVALTGSGEAPKVEFKLRLIPPVRISGQLVSYDSRQLLSGAIIMSPIEGDGLPMPPPENPSILPDGDFSFGDVVPGRYQIRARGQTESSGPALFGVFAVDVAGADIDGIRLTLRPGAILEGSLVVESAHGTKPPLFSTLHVRAPFADGTGFGDSLTGTVQANGSFTLRGIMKGQHQIVVDGLHPPWVLKSVTYRGADVTDVQIDAAEKQLLSGVRVTITDESSEVSGLVRNAQSAPVPNTGVLVFPKVPLFWNRTGRRMRIAYTDNEGRFSVAGLPAGDYVAVASPSVDERDFGRRDRLEAWEAIGTPFRLESDRGRADVRLQVMAAPPGGTSTIR
jgi:carboxypeptidase family protein